MTDGPIDKAAQPILWGDLFEMTYRKSHQWDPTVPAEFPPPFTEETGLDMELKRMGLDIPSDLGDYSIYTDPI